MKTNREPQTGDICAVGFIPLIAIFIVIIFTIVGCTSTFELEKPVAQQERAEKGVK